MPLNSIVCKFRCSTVSTHDWGGLTVKLSALYDDKLGKDKRFAESTPNGTLEATINNSAPGVKEFLEPGKSYYLVLHEVNEETTAIYAPD